MSEKPVNWRPRDVSMYLGFVFGMGATTVLEFYGASVFLGGLALLELVEMTLHAISDAVSGRRGAPGS